MNEKDFDVQNKNKEWKLSLKLQFFPFCDAMCQGITQLLNICQKLFMNSNFQSISYHNQRTIARFECEPWLQFSHERVGGRSESSQSTFNSYLSPTVQLLNLLALPCCITRVVALDGFFHPPLNSIPCRVLVMLSNEWTLRILPPSLRWYGLFFDESDPWFLKRLCFVECIFMLILMVVVWCDQKRWWLYYFNLFEVELLLLKLPVTVRCLWSEF